MISQIKRHGGWLVAAIAVVAMLAVACGGTKSASNRVSSAPPSNASGTSSGDKALAGAPRDGVSVQTDGSVTAPQSLSSGERAVGATGGEASSGGTTNPAQLPSQLDRKIIQVATLDITVDAVSKNFENVGNIAAGFGGFVASSQFGNTGDRQTASITIRVPGDKYQDALAQLRKLGDVKGEQSGGNDVTEEYTDLQSRARNLQSVEAQYVEFLQRATTITEVLTVQDRLNATRAEIEQVQGRINLLQHQTDLATITVHLDPPIVAKVEPKTDKGNSSPLDVAADSFKASLAVLLGIATVVLAVAAFSWWLVPVGIVGLVVARKQMRATSDRRAIPPAPPATS